DDALPRCEAGQGRDDAEQFGGFCGVDDRVHARSLPARADPRTVDPSDCAQVALASDCAGRLTACTAYHEGVDNFWIAAAWSILPTIAVSAVFVMVLRGILRFDRTERKVHARIEAEERAARGLPPRSL